MTYSDMQQSNLAMPPLLRSVYRNLCHLMCHGVCILQCFPAIKLPWLTQARTSQPPNECRYAEHTQGGRDCGQDIVTVVGFGRSTPCVLKKIQLFAGIHFVMHVGAETSGNPSARHCCLLRSYLSSASDVKWLLLCPPCWNAGRLGAC